MGNRNRMGYEVDMTYQHRVWLNARRMTTRDRAHAHIKRRLALPKWYGNNLDALSDCLGEIGTPTRIIIRFAPLVPRQLGEYGEKLIRVFTRGAEENENLSITLRKWW